MESFDSSYIIEISRFKVIREIQRYDSIFEFKEKYNFHYHEEAIESFICILNDSLHFDIELKLYEDVVHCSSSMYIKFVEDTINYHDKFNKKISKKLIKKWKNVCKPNYLITLTKDGNVNYINYLKLKEILN